MSDPIIDAASSDVATLQMAIDALEAFRFHSAVRASTRRIILAAVNTLDEERRSLQADIDARLDAATAKAFRSL